MATKIQKNTAKLMIEKLQAKLDALYEEQESMKTPKQGMKCGGKVNRKKMPTGGQYDDPMKLSPRLDPYSWNYDIDLGVSPISTNKLAGTNTNGQFGNRYSASDFKSAGGYDWGNAAYNVGTGAPFIYNLIKGLQKPELEYAKDYYNPYTGDILEDLRKRRYNIDPVLEANKAAQRMYNRNVINASGGNRGTLLGNLGAGMTNRQGADATALTQASNVNNQYLADLAAGKMDLGNQMAQTNFMVQDINARNKAARDAHLAAATSQFSNLLQTNKLMGNQEERDEQKAGLIPDMFSVSEFMPYLKMLAGGF